MDFFSFFYCNRKRFVKNLGFFFCWCNFVSFFHANFSCKNLGGWSFYGVKIYDAFFSWFLKIYRIFLWKTWCYFCCGTGFIWHKYFFFFVSAKNFKFFVCVSTSLIFFLFFLSMIACFFAAKIQFFLLVWMVHSFFWG